MPLKIKELRSRADESMRLIQAYQQEGVEPPVNLDNHFKYLLLMIAKLYKNDPLNLNLVLDYWCHHSDSSHVSTSMHSHRLPSKQVALFKFIRLAGEILPSGLFVPYLNMIASLASSSQAARQAFNFLKPNGSSGSTTVSWDHFFSSLNRYYYNLRQELPPIQDTVYRQRGHPKGITPNEIKGLEAVLQVVQVVAKYDKLSRVALCDHTGWKVLQSLIGLVSCAMPIPLKGVLIKTLAVLAKSSESSSTVWQNLEAAQIITTVSSTSSYQPRGVQTELEEIESRNEEYPLTISILELLDILTDFPVPRLLGIGHRNPGFEPYLNFIINTVFLKFHHRSYKNSVEKWIIATLCLKILKKLLTNDESFFEDNINYKVETHSSTEVNNFQLTYNLISQFHSSTELLRTVFYIIAEGCNYFDTYHTLPGQKYLKESTLYCLEIIEYCLKTQNLYMTQLSVISSHNNIFTGLSRLLLGVNYRTGKSDHMIDITKYVLYNNWLQQHAYVAIGIIKIVSNEPGADTELLSIFTSTPWLTTHIRHGFIECLDINDPSSIGCKRENDEKKKSVFYCKDKIILFLMQSITRPAPNIAHYLLGFEITKEIKKTVIQQPGIMGYPRTCLHSILSILELSLENGRDKTTELCYWFLYTLVSNTKTSTPVLRFLRTSTNLDFVQRHLSKLPFQGSNRATELICMSWLLKIAAIELRVGSGSLQNFLIQRFVGYSEHDKDKSTNSQKLLMDLLHYIDFYLKIPSTKAWEFFDPSQIEIVFGRCSVSSAFPNGPQIIDIKKLHLIILQDLFVTQTSATTTQRKLMHQELQLILTHALKKNQTKTLSYATVRFVEGWCQITEILFSIVTVEQFPIAQKQNFLLHLSHDLLQKMTSCEVLNEIKTLVSGTILILLVNLRVSFELQFENELLPSSPANTTMMKVILNQILQWILNSEDSSQKVRTHLFGALLYFLSVIGSEKSKKISKNIESTYVSQLDNSLHQTLTVKEYSHRYTIIQVINSFGDKLIDIICHSCSGGHDVCKMLGLSCLNKIIELDHSSQWIIYLSSRGYLKHMIDSLLESDISLRNILQVDNQSLKPLYLYEAKMAMFNRMASIRLGAECLLENKILSCLSSMSVIDQYQDLYHNFNDTETSFLPSISHRYQKIFLPMLYLCDALLSTLGTENQSCTIQVCGFLQCHREIIEMKLKNVSSTSNLLVIDEVVCLTGVIARSANINTYKLLEEELEKSNLLQYISSNSGIRELRAYLYKLQKLMLTILLKFNPLNERRFTSKNFSCIQIVQNVLLYIKNQMEHCHINKKIRNILFEPYLMDKEKTYDFQKVETSSEMHLGVVVEHLNLATELLHELKRKYQVSAEKSSSDLQKLVGEGEKNLDIKKQRIIDEHEKHQQEKNLSQNIKYVSMIIEYSLYILWSHLDFYVMQSLAQSSFYVSKNSDDMTFEWRKFNEQLPKLREGLLSVLTDSFTTSILEIYSDRLTTDQGFIEILVRRIQRLLQFIVVK